MNVDSYFCFLQSNCFEQEKVKCEDEYIVQENQILEWAGKVVDRFVMKEFIPRRERDDIQMSLVEKFWVKKKELLNRFQGNSKLSTYCIAILNRMCLELIRSQKKNWNLVANEYFAIEQSLDNPYHVTIIRQEAQTLHRILQLFDDEEAKIRLFSAFSYLLKIREADVASYDTKYKKHKLLRLFLTTGEITKSEVFQILSKVEQVVEKKTKQPDAVRMWINKNKKTSIRRLNLNHGKKVYNNESYQLLFEYYYSEWLRNFEELQ